MIFQAYKNRMHQYNTNEIDLNEKGQIPFVSCRGTPHVSRQNQHWLGQQKVHKKFQKSILAIIKAIQHCSLSKCMKSLALDNVMLDLK
jgi:hypothetical protein